MLKKNLSALFPRSSESMNKPVDSVELFNVIHQFHESDIKVEVNNINGGEVIAISELINRAISKNKNVIFTFTPGPFIDANELPENWMSVPMARGCTNQLLAFEAAFKDLNAVIFAVNKHPSSYQRELLAKKNLSHLFMISDADGTLEKTFKFPTIKIPGDNSHYFNRFSFVFRANNDMRTVFIPTSPVDQLKAKEHVDNIKDFNNQIMQCFVPKSRGK